MKTLGPLALICLALSLAYFLFPLGQRQPAYQREGEKVDSKISPERPAQLDGRQPPSSAGAEEESEGESFEQLAQKALNDPDPEERASAVEELWQSEDQRQAVAILLKILHNDREGDVRRAALDGLEEMEGLAFDTLAKVVLNDPDPSLRVRAVELIGQRGERGRKLVDFLKRVVKTDKDEDVRQAAMELLEEMNP